MAELVDVPRHRIVPLVLRRMRPPLLTLISAYAVAILGLVLIPGVGGDGAPVHMSFFHAFYFVTYTASTIGFGEIPHTFTDAQRMWVTGSIYVLVVSWFYAIGTIVALVRDPVFQRVVVWNRFRHNVSRIDEPFVLICGYGDTGTQLAWEVTEGLQRAVVIDWDERKLDGLSTEGHRSYIPSLCGDANLTDNLLAAGLTHPGCRAVLAVTDADHTNLHIAVTAKLLNPEVMVIARAENEETRDNMASFGTDHIINPYETFAGGFLLAIEAPNAHRLYAWMSSRRELPEGSERLPRQGCWIICGFSALGRALYERFSEFGLRTVIVDPEEPRELPASQPFVAGKGTEAATLQEAGIAGDGVAGVIAATDDDTDNLSIAVTARELVPTLYVVARQNHATNRHIFAAAKVDMVMESNRVIALRMLRLLATPMLPQFLHLIRGRDEQWLGTLVERWGARIGEATPLLWGMTVSDTDTPELRRAQREGRMVSVRDLLRDARDRRVQLPAEVLMILRDREPLLLPPHTTTLEAGDQLLLCGRADGRARVRRTVNDQESLHYVLTGEHPAHGLHGRWLGPSVGNRVNLSP